MEQAQTSVHIAEPEVCCGMNASALKCLACMSGIVISIIVVFFVATSQIGPLVGEVIGIMTAGIIGLAIFYHVCSIACRNKMSTEQQIQAEGGNHICRQRKAAAGKVHPQAP